MEVVHPRCAGIDVSKRDAKVCVRVAGRGRRGTQQTVTTWGATTNRILALREQLVAEQVTCAVMEATGDLAPTRCLICGAMLAGRADQRYCGHARRQAAHRRRTTPAQPPAPPLPTPSTRHAHTVYECDTCGQRLAGEQWCPA